MNYGKIINCDTANARGLSVVLFVSGCTNHCEKCHNKETWDFNYGQPYTKETEDLIIDLLKKQPFVKNLVISGGDPLHKKNSDTVLKLCKRVKEEVPNKTIIIYTGYTYKVDRIDFSKFKGAADYLIDGKFDYTKVTPILDYRGSLNQRCFKITDKDFIDVSKDYFRTT